MTDLLALTIPVQAVEITRAALGDSPMGELFDEAEQLAIDAKAAAGHADHEGWRTEDNCRRIHCGCDVLLLELPSDRQGQPARVAVYVDEELRR